VVNHLSSPRDSALHFKEDGLRHLSAEDTSDLALAFALGAPPQHALAALEAIGRVFCAEMEGGLASTPLDTPPFLHPHHPPSSSPKTAPPPQEEKNEEKFDDSAAAGLVADTARSLRTVELALARLIQPPPSSAQAAVTLQKIPSFDEEPTWEDGEAEARRRSLSFKKPSIHPVHRLRGESSSHARSSPASTPPPSSFETTGEAVRREEGGGVEESPKVSLGTRSTWTARILHKSPPRALLQFASALAFVFPSTTAASRVRESSSVGIQQSPYSPLLPAFLTQPCWAGGGGGGGGSSSIPVSPSRLASGLLHKTRSQAHSAQVQETLRAVLRALCSRIGEGFIARGGEWGYGARILPLLSSRQGLTGREQLVSFPSPAPTWPAESLTRHCARVLLLSLQHHKNRRDQKHKASPLSMQEKAQSGPMDAPHTAAAASATLSPAALSLPLAAYGSLCSPFSTLVERSLHRVVGGHPPPLAGVLTRHTLLWLTKKRGYCPFTQPWMTVGVDGRSSSSSWNG